MFFRHLRLSELVVTGVTGETKLKHSPAPISIIRPQELRSAASTNIIDAIATQPGVSQLTTGSGISKPIIRGLGYNRVVVMNDGVRQEGQQWGDEHGIEIDASGVGSVEILKGPASLMYGSDAMAGVIIMHRPTLPAEGEMKATASTEYHTNNGLWAYSVNATGNQQGLVWDARISQKKAHAYKNSYDGYVPGSQFGERAASIMGGVQRQWGRSLLTLSTYQLTPSICEGERDGETGQLEHAEGWRAHSYGKTLPYQQVGHFKAVWDNSLNIGNGASLKAIVGYQQNNRKEYEEEEEEEEAGDATGGDTEQEDDGPGLYLRLHTLTYDVRYLTGEYDGWRLSAGIGGMWQQSQNKGDEYLIPDYRLLDCGLFATATKSIGTWTLSGGLRYDHRSMHGDELTDDGELRFTDFARHFNGITGSAGAVCNISDGLTLRVNMARGFRTPNMSELSSNGVHEGTLRYEIGNQRLKAEYSLQADLGLDYTSRYVSAQVALFANRIDNYIYLRGEGTDDGSGAAAYDDSGLREYTYTQGDARLMGLEASIDMHPIHSLHFANTFSYVDARLLHQQAGASYLPSTPAPRWTSELKWELTHHSHVTLGHNHAGAHHHFTSRIALNNTYVAARLECNLRQGHVYSAYDTETATPSYTLLGMQAGTDVLMGGRKIFELYITASNLLNRSYQSHLSRLKYADINTATGRRGVYNMGRNIAFKLVWTL
ncbi:MAG: TonB-dependent receptor [Prevotella sp.]|nr:TonB-dependent receptor [Prevotella sp.]